MALEYIVYISARTRIIYIESIVCPPNPPQLGAQQTLESGGASTGLPWHLYTMQYQYTVIISSMEANEVMF